MLRSFAARLAPAVPPAARKAAEMPISNVPIQMAANTTPANFAFASAYEAERANAESPLAAPAYAALARHLEAYDDMLRKYSVKQSELERMKRAANVCGLDFLKPKARVDTSSVRAPAGDDSNMPVS
jgi:hypothetical protein